MASVARIGVFVAAVALAGPSLAANPSGSVVAVVQSAHIDGKTGQQILEPAAPVYSGDRIDTGSVGTAQIKFRDNTKLVVGPNSSMVIDAFVFNDNNTARQVSINALKGAFRFITGDSRKDAYKITTPTATIGVRGTEFDIAIESGGTTRIANFEGATHLCKRNADGSVDAASCADVSQQCTLSVIRPTQQKVQPYSNTDVEFRNRQLKYYFPYVRSQQELMKDFKVDLAPCHLDQVALPGAGNGPTGPGPTPQPPFVPQAPGPLPAPQPPTPGPLNDSNYSRPNYR
jgi:FecR protein